MVCNNVANPVSVLSRRQALLIVNCFELQSDAVPVKLPKAAEAAVVAGGNLRHDGMI